MVNSETIERTTRTSVVMVSVSLVLSLSVIKVEFVMKRF
jgi:hypothetical protein